MITQTVKKSPEARFSGGLFHFFKRKENRIPSAVQAWSSLRRGAGCYEDTSSWIEMIRAVGSQNLIPREAYSDKQAQRWYITLASLYTLHPIGTKYKSFGDSFRRLRQVRSENVVRMLFDSMMDSNSEFLPGELFHAITLMSKSPTQKGPIRINWGQLLTDVLNWEDDEVRKRWAIDCWM